MLRRLILVTILMVLSSGPAYAEWVMIGSSEIHGGYTIYSNPDTLRRKGNTVKVWEIIDFKTVQGDTRRPYSSVKKQNEYDCLEERQRLVAMSYYSGNMGDGLVVYKDSDPSEWTPISPESVGEAMWKFACAKP